MTQADIPSRIVIPSAFAAKSTKVLPDGSMDTEGNVVNFADGFPSVYGCPSGGNGKFVTREEMNALGKIATLDHYIRACGGVFQFDPYFACAKGGYAKGAVLDFVEGFKFSKVISLVDDNLVDYTGSSPVTVGSVSTISGSVDNVNWAYAYSMEQPEFDFNVSVPDMMSYGTTEVVAFCGAFCAPKDGSVGMIGSIDITKSERAESLPCFRIVCVKAGTSSNSLSGKDISTAGAVTIFEAGQPYIGQTVSAMSIEKGYYYAVFAGMTDGSATSSRLKIVLI